MGDKVMMIPSDLSASSNPDGDWFPQFEEGWAILALEGIPSDAVQTIEPDVAYGAVCTIGKLVSFLETDRARTAAVEATLEEETEENPFFAAFATGILDLLANMEALEMHDCTDFGKHPELWDTMFASEDSNG